MTIFLNAALVCADPAEIVRLAELHVIDTDLRQRLLPLQQDKPIRSRNIEY
jgi:hypothetical protein